MMLGDKRYIMVAAAVILIAAVAAVFILQGQKMGEEVEMMQKKNEQEIKNIDGIEDIIDYNRISPDDKKAMEHREKIGFAISRGKQIIDSVAINAGLQSDHLSSETTAEEKERVEKFISEASDFVTLPAQYAAKLDSSFSDKEKTGVKNILSQYLINTYWEEWMQERR